MGLNWGFSALDALVSSQHWAWCYSPQRTASCLRHATRIGYDFGSHQFPAPCWVCGISLTAGLQFSALVCLFFKGFLLPASRLKPVGLQFPGAPDPDHVPYMNSCMALLNCEALLFPGFHILSPAPSLLRNFPIQAPLSFQKALSEKEFPPTTPCLPSHV